MLSGSCHCGSAGREFDGDPSTAVACNRTICRRYDALWAYDWVGGRITARGPPVAYTWGEREIEFHHCPTCGCITWWRGTCPHSDGRTRIAVNLRLADDPSAIAALRMRHFDGLDRFTDLPGDHRRVSDTWF